jgi:hypothetical protein
MHPIIMHFRKADALRNPGLKRRPLAALRLSVLPLGNQCQFSRLLDRLLGIQF